MLQPTTPEKLGKKEDPKRDTRGGPQEKKIIKISWEAGKGSRREELEDRNTKDPDDQVGGAMERGSNERDTLIEGTLVG